MATISKNLKTFCITASGAGAYEQLSEIAGGPFGNVTATSEAEALDKFAKENYESVGCTLSECLANVGDFFEAINLDAEDEDEDEA